MVSVRKGACRDIPAGHELTISRTVRPGEMSTDEFYFQRLVTSGSVAMNSDLEFLRVNPRIIPEREAYHQN